MVRRNSDQWQGIVYAVSNAAAGAGTLYRLERTEHRTNLVNLAADLNGVLPGIPGNGWNLDTNFHRVADGVVHFQVHALDTNGYVIIDSSLSPPFVHELVDELPGALEIELGVLEPKEWEKIKGRSAAESIQFLTNRAERVHLFRQTIPIRSRQ